MNPLVQRVGWMLVHSVWEDLLIGVVLQIALLLLARKTPQGRYLASCLALVAMAVLPWLTFGATDLTARLEEAHSVTSAAAMPAVAPSGIDQAPPSPISGAEAAWTPQFRDLARYAPDYLSPALPFLVAIWTGGLVLFSVRLWMRWRHVSVLIRQPFRLLDDAWRRRFDQLRQISGVRRLVRLGETAAVSVPIVAGWLKPVILLPLGVATSLPAEQIEAILLHELAHISRHDYLVNLLQNIVETVFFYHPAVWSVSRRIRLERELACDDLTIQWCKSPRIYAEALAGFEEFRHQSPLLAATGEGDLLARIRRILAGQGPERRAVPIFAVAGFCGIGIYLASMFLAPLFAAKLMTDQQRIATITAAQTQDQGPVETELSGTLEADDGKPLSAASPTNLQIFSFSGGPNFSSTSSIWLNGNPFSQTVRGKLISLSVWATGYAPLFVETKTEGGKVGPLSLVLKRGIPARLRLVGPDGMPIADVRLKGTFSHSGAFASIIIPEMVTDANGEAVVKNVVADTLLMLNAEKPGWQLTERILGDWKPGQVAIWQLKPSSPTTGAIVDQETRQPVGDADIMLASISRGDPLVSPGGPTFLFDPTTTTYNPFDTPPPPLLAHTDSHGRFRLDTLNDADSYWVYAWKPGYQLTSLPVKSGGRDLKIELDRGFSVKGRILDPDGLLKKAEKPLTIGAEASIQVNEHDTTGYRLFAPVRQTGSEMTFSFASLPKGKRTFRVNYLDSYDDFDLEKNTDDLVIDLSAPSRKKAASPPRVVQIRLDPGPGHTPATGLIGVESESGPSPIVNGQVSLSVSAPGDVTIDPDGLIGYWFMRQDFKVPAGNQPFLKTVSIFPAGVIRGKVTSDPSVRDQPFGCIAFVIKRAPCLEYGGGGVTAIIGSRPLVPQTSYMTPSLPFGGTYAVLLCPNAGANFAVSPAFTVDAEHPIIECDLHRAGGETLRGRFLDAKNQPIGRSAIALVYHPPNDVGWNQSVSAGMTAPDGTFAIPHVNLNVPGYYQAQLYDPKWAENTVHLDRHTQQPVTLIAQPRR